MENSHNPRINFEEAYKSLRSLEIAVAINAGWKAEKLENGWVLRHPLGVNARAMWDPGKVGGCYPTELESMEADTPDFHTVMKELTDLFDLRDIQWSLIKIAKSKFRGEIVYHEWKYLGDRYRTVCFVHADIATIALLVAYYTAFISSDPGMFLRSEKYDEENDIWITCKIDESDESTEI